MWPWFLRLSVQRRPKTFPILPRQYRGGNADSAIQSVNGKTGTNVTLNKDDIGLDSVDNTSDDQKPISLATQTALDAKANTSSLGTAAYQNSSAFASSSQGGKADTAVQSVNGKSGTSITLSKSDVGLSNVDNTADANKPISTATQTALNGKATTAQGAKADTAIQAPGGSIGQVLTKNSGTDGDVAWQTVAAATAVSYGPQTLTAPQQAQARTNISAFEQPSGTTAQYLRGDGSTATMNKAAVGLSNVDNTADSAKPVSTAQQTALNAKANTTSPTLEGTTTINNLRLGQGTTVGKVALSNNNGVYIAEIGIGSGTGDLGKVGFYNSINGGWWMNGNFQITGTVSKGGGTFLIDHPLDPLNKNLRHGFVEAPEYVNIYRGEVRLVNGRATVNIDEHFEMTAGTFWALNTDITVSSLQNQEGFARVRPLAKMTSGQLEIVCEDDDCNDLIAWAVTGRRKDAFVLYMDENCESATGRFIPEFNKPDYSEAENG